MPRIETYELRTQAASPTRAREQDPEAFGAGVAQSKQNLSDAQGGALSRTADIVANTINEAVAQREESKLQAKMAEAQERYTSKVIDVTKNGDPDDETVAQKISEEYDQDMSRLSDGIITRRGRQYFDRTSSTLKTQVVTHAKAAQAELAGIAARKNYVKGRAGIFNTVRMNPDSFEFNKLQLDEMILTTLGGKLKLEDVEAERVKAKYDLAEMAVRGRIDLDPDDAYRFIKGGNMQEEDLPADSRKRLEGEIHAAQENRFHEAERIRKEEERIYKERTEETETDWFHRMMPGSKNPLSLKDVDNADVPSAVKDEWKKKLISKITDGDPLEEIQFFRKAVKNIFLPEGDPRRVSDKNTFFRDYVGNGKLKFDKAEKLLALFEMRKGKSGELEGVLLNRFLEAQDEAIKGSSLMSSMDPNVKYRKYQAALFALSKVQEYRDQGKSIYPLIDEANKGEFLGQHTKNFMPDPDEILNSLANSFEKPTGMKGADTSKLPKGIESSEPEAILKFDKRKLKELEKHRGKLTPAQREAAEKKALELWGPPK